MPTHPIVQSRKADDEIIFQTSYSDVISGPTFDTEFEPIFDAIEVISGGIVEIVTAETNRKIPMSTGRIYPIEIHEIRASNTGVNAADILLYRK